MWTDCMNLSLEFSCSGTIFCSWMYLQKNSVERLVWHYVGVCVGFCWWCVVQVGGPQSKRWHPGAQFPDSTPPCSWLFVFGRKTSPAFALDYSQSRILQFPFPSSDQIPVSILPFSLSLPPTSLACLLTVGTSVCTNELHLFQFWIEHWLFFARKCPGESFLCAFLLDTASKGWCRASAVSQIVPKRSLFPSFCLPNLSGELRASHKLEIDSQKMIRTGSMKDLISAWWGETTHERPSFGFSSAVKAKTSGGGCSVWCVGALWVPCLKPFWPDSFCSSLWQTHTDTSEYFECSSLAQDILSLLLLWFTTTRVGRSLTRGWPCARAVDDHTRTHNNIWRRMRPLVESPGGWGLIRFMNAAFKLQGENMKRIDFSGLLYEWFC